MMKIVSKSFVFVDMDQFGGFSYSDYDVMNRSCNTFTYELSKRLGVSDKYPMGILHQSKLGEFLAPVVHAINVLAASCGFGSGCLDCQNQDEAISHSQTETLAASSSNRESKTLFKR